MALTGSELLTFVKEREDTHTRAQLAREAGYVRTTEKGKEQVLVKAFNDALLSATGVNLRIGKGPGRGPQYETTVHKSGVVLLGRSYTEKFDLQPGDVLEIELDDAANCIRLIPKVGDAMDELEDAIA